MKRRNLNRRHFLKGLGIAVNLPLLEIMINERLWAQNPEYPVRFAALVFPYGTYQDTLTPRGQGFDYQIPSAYAPLENLKPEFSMLRHINNYHGAPNGDGAGDHAREMGTYLTCSYLNKSHTNIRAGRSVDQIIADHTGKLTPIRSLNIRLPGTEGDDSGYSSLYKNLSWENEHTPAATIGEPRDLFHYLFTDHSNVMAAKQQKEERRRRQMSILDAIKDEVNGLESILGQDDRHRLDHWLTSIREIEKRLTHEQTHCEVPLEPYYDSNFHEKSELIYDLTRLAWRCDLTRVLVFSLGSPYQGTHHSWSHHSHHPSKTQPLINEAANYARHFARFLEQLRQEQEGDRSLLDNAIITFGSGLRDGNIHDHEDLPMIVAGRGGGALNPGRCIDNGSTEMASLWLTIMRIMGVNQSSFGQGKGRSTEIIANL